MTKRRLVQGPANPVYLSDDLTGEPMGDAERPLRVESATDMARDASAAYTHAPAANTAAVVTLAAPGAGNRHVIAGIYWSYNDDPTGGNLIVVDTASIVFQVDITNSGPGFFQFNPPLQFGVNSQVRATLAAAGAAVTGKLNLHTWVE